MIKRYILHIEFHKGYWPRVSLRKMIKPGQVGTDGGLVGRFQPCPTCSSTGTLFLPDILPEPTRPGITVNEDRKICVCGCGRVVGPGWDGYHGR